MKKTLNFFTLLFISTALIFGSCKKEEAAIAPSQESSRTASATGQSISMLASTINYRAIYDSIGIAHNQAIPSILSRLESNPDNLDGDTLSPSAINIIETNVIDYLRKTNSDFTSDKESIVRNEIEKNINAYYNQNTYNDLPSELKALCNQVLNQYYSMSSESEITAMIDSNFNATINTIDDNNIALAYTAFMGTLKYSNIYWSERTQGVATMALSSSINKGMAAADAVGAVKGGYEGAVAGGVIGGPPGAVAVGIVCAIGESVSASCGEYLMEKFTEFLFG